MYPREKIIYDELEYEINKIVNSYIFVNENFTNIELSNLIQDKLYDFVARMKLYDYKVLCNYPNLEIYIHIFKGGEIHIIKPIRFERLKKLKKLNGKN